MHIPRAFTLVELLVVITVIVLLMALLVPAMDQAIYPGVPNVFDVDDNARAHMPRN